MGPSSIILSIELAIWCDDDEDGVDDDAIFRPPPPPLTDFIFSRLLFNSKLLLLLWLLLLKILLLLLIDKIVEVENDGWWCWLWWWCDERYEEHDLLWLPSFEFKWHEHRINDVDDKSDPPAKVDEHDGVIFIAVSSVNGSDRVRWCTGCIILVILDDGFITLLPIIPPPPILIAPPPLVTPLTTPPAVFRICDWLLPLNEMGPLGNENARWWHVVADVTVNYINFDSKNRKKNCFVK